MKLSIKSVKVLGASLATISAILLAVTGGNANAASTAQCLYQYSDKGFSTSATPVFNSICGVNEGIGDEPNFVRIRPDVSGNDEDNQGNPNYTIGSLAAACNSGDKFDVWNYVHNNADQADNPDTGNGSAVAKNAAINMTADLGKTSNTFNFDATVSADNATAVTASNPPVLNCGNQQVKLSLVTSSVHIYSQPYGGWQNLSDNSVNSPVALGSTKDGLSSMGSGTMWGCWTYRIVIVYQVQVTPVAPQPTPPTCNLLTLESNGEVAKVEGLDYTANNANVSGATFQFFNNNNQVNSQTLTVSELQNLKSSPLTYNFNTTGNFKVVATVNSDMGNVTSPSCSGTFTASTPPVTPPPSTPPTTTVVTTSATHPTVLPSTGAGSVAGIFAGVSVAGAAGYRWLLGRRLSRQ